MPPVRGIFPRRGSPPGRPTHGIEPQLPARLERPRETLAITSSATGSSPGNAHDVNPRSCHGTAVAFAVHRPRLKRANAGSQTTRSTNRPRTTEYAVFPVRLVIGRRWAIPLSRAKESNRPAHGRYGEPYLGPRACGFRHHLTVCRLHRSRGPYHALCSRNWCWLEARGDHRT